MITVNQALDRFFMNRIGIRMLIGQHSENQEDPDQPGRVHILNPKQIAQDASERATLLCKDIYGRAPPVQITMANQTNSSFIYVESHLHHMVRGWLMRFVYRSNAKSMSDL